LVGSIVAGIDWPKMRGVSTLTNNDLAGAFGACGVFRFGGSIASTEIERR